MNAKDEKCDLPEEQVQLLLGRVVELYAQNLANSDTAKARLGHRGLTDFALFERNEVGYSDGRLPQLIPTDADVRKQLCGLGLLTSDTRERLNGCLIFPIRDLSGRIGDLWCIPPKGPHRFLLNRATGFWHADAVRHSAHLYVVPDPIDGLSLLAAGQPNVVALHEGQGVPDVEALDACGVQRLTIVIGDCPQGRAAAQALQAKLRPRPALILALPGAGANDVLRANGAKKLEESLLAETHGLTTLSIPGLVPLPTGFSLPIGPRRYEVRGLEHSTRRLKATIRIERSGRLYVDTLDFYLASARKKLICDLVRFLEESASAIEADVAKLLSACELRATQPDMAVGVALSEQMPERDRAEGEALGHDTRLFETVVDDIEQLGVIGERRNKLLGYLCMSSRKMSQPLSVMFLSGTGTGKSTVQNAICALCPLEDIEKVTALSPKALYYKSKDALKHKVLALDEESGVRNAGYALRVLISEGELVSEVAMKDAVSGRLVAVRTRVEGPVAVLVTTAAPDTDPETKSRFLVTAIDESRAQTAAILELQRKAQSVQELEKNRNAEAIRRRHHAFQRLLQPLAVVNPLVDRLTFSDRKLTSRRDQPKILQLIAATAFLRQMQKTIKTIGGVNYIEVDEEDLAIARPLIAELAAFNLSDQSHPGAELLRILDEMRRQARTHPTSEPAGGSVPFVFTRRQIREFSGWEHTRVHRYLRELITLEYVVPQNARRGVAHTYSLEWQKPKTDTNPGFGLPFATG
jgi:hypothetical protein